MDKGGARFNSHAQHGAEPHELLHDASPEAAGRPSHTSIQVSGTAEVSGKNETSDKPVVAPTRDNEATALVVRLQFHAAPESGGRQPQLTKLTTALCVLILHPSRSSETPSLAARPVMCEAGREEPFDELSAWIFSPTLTQHSYLMSTQCGFFIRR